MLRLIRDFFFPSAYDLSNRRTQRSTSSPTGSAPAGQSASSQPVSRQA